MKRIPLRLAAAAAAGMLFCSLGMGSMAMADPGDPTMIDGESQANASNDALINPDATVRLSIHKYLGAPVGLPNNGTEQTVTGVEPLNGVAFDVYKVVGIDLTTNAGWEAATALQAHTITDAEIAAQAIVIGGTTYALEGPTTVTTTGQGLATFTQTNGVGLYLVNENLAASTSITKASDGTVVPANQITPSDPFLVTLPMTNPATLDTWMYDVNVYPKNQQDTIEKTVNDKGTVTTENGTATDNDGTTTITYMLSSTITDGMNGPTDYNTPGDAASGLAQPQIGMYQIVDQLDWRVTYGSVSVAVGAENLTENTDYTLANVPESGTTGTKVVINLTAVGLQKLVDANKLDADATVTTTIEVTLDEEGADGVITNQGSFIPNQGWADQNPDSDGVPSNEVESKYGDIIVNKQDPKDTANKAAMDGAEFAVYADPTAGDGVCSASDVAGTPIATQTISGGTATLTFKGLQASNWYNDGATSGEITDPAEFLSYCLVETKAPAGYNLDATPHYIVIDHATGTVSAPAFATQVVNNEKSNLDNSLPLTGGQGVAAMSIGGLLLIGGGLGYHSMVTRRRRAEA